MRLVWLWTQKSKEERIREPLHPILSMANWLKDAQASQAEGKPVFRLPYPGGTWIEEKERNKELLFLMETAWKVAAVGFKQSKNTKLTADEEKLINEIAKHL